MKQIKLAFNETYTKRTSPWNIIKVTRGGERKKVIILFKNRMDFVPERSALDKDRIIVDPDTRAMLESLGFKDLEGVVTERAGKKFQKREFKKKN